MKLTKICLLFFCLPAIVWAKDEKDVQFIENKGQVTDQHGTVRNDIDAKIEANGVVMFVGNGEWHYQWARPVDSKRLAVGSTSGASIPPPSAKLTPQPAGDNTASSVEIYRMDVQLVGANKNAQVIFEEPTGYYENYYLAHTGENGVTAKGYGRVIYKDIYPNIDLVFYTAPMSGASIPPPSAKLTPPPAGDNTLSLSPAGGGGEVRAGGGTLAQEIHNESSPARGDRGVGSRPSFAEAAAGNVKYDFIVHPGGNPADIRLRYEGATDVKLVNRELLAVTPFGSITEAAPYCYRAETGEEVSSAFKLSGNTLSFDIGSYIGTLVIDPALRWGTYFGGNVNDGARDVHTSFDGYIYITGSTTSTANLATTGAHQASFAGGPGDDVFIAKFDDSCHLLWATYYGGNNTDGPGGICSDRLGNVYICGSTASDTGIATAGAHRQYHGDFPLSPGTLEWSDAFLAKFSSSGQRLWATYYGAAGPDAASDVVCDGNNNIYICGPTGSAGSITTPGAFIDTFLPYNINSFLAKFNGAGQRLWGTYFADSNGQYLFALACDAQNNIYTGGYSGTNPLYNKLGTLGTHQPAPTVGTMVQRDGILAKFSSSGARLWCTYYGGADGDGVLDITCDDSGHVYAVGHTGSITHIATNGAQQGSPNDGNDGFLVKFNSSSGTRVWGTYFGGNGYDQADGIAVCPRGRVYITGFTQSSSGLATPGAYKTVRPGGNDAYLAEFTPGGQLLYSTYYGGTGNEITYGSTSQFRTLRLSSGHDGVIYMAGGTGSSSGIAAGAAHQAASGGGRDAMLIAWFTDTTAYIKQPYTDTVWCPGDTVKIVYGVNQPFSTGNTFTVQLSNDTGGFISPVTIGSKAATENDTITCVIPLNTPPGAKYRIRITGTTPVRISQDNDWDIRIKAIPTAFGNASNSPVCTGDTLRLLGSSDSTNITWAWTGPGSFSSAAKDTFISNAQLADSGQYILKATLNSTGCSLTDTTTVEMRPTPDKPVAGSNSPVCEFNSLQLTATSSTSGVTYSWNGPGSYGSNTQNPTVTNSAGSSHAGDYISTVTLNGCSNKDTTTVVVLPKPAKPTAAAPNSPLCQRQDLQLTASTVTGAGYTWYGPSAFTANMQNPVRQYVQLADAGTYYVYATINGCISDTDSVAVVVNTDPFVNIFPTPGATICPGRQVVFTAVPTNGGTSPTYAWYRNGIATGSTGLTYTTSSLTNGDIVYCLMTSVGACATPFTDTSNAITMTVLPVKIPKVTISADAGPSLFPNEPINFTATYSDAGANPTFQWRRSGKDVQGATGDVWGANANFLADGDEICVLINSSYECPLPDTVLSNCIKLQIRVGVDDIVHNKNITIYPNPTTGSFNIEMPQKGNYHIQVMNMLGLVVYEGDMKDQQKTSIQLDNNLPPGNYTIHISGDALRHVNRITLMK